MVKIKREINQPFGVMIYMIAIVIQFITGFIFSALHTKGTINDNTFVYISYAIPQTCYILVFLLVYLVFYGRNVNELLLKENVKGVHYPLAILMGIGMLFFGLLPTTQFTLLMAKLGSSAITVVPQLSTWYDYILSAIIICIMPAIGEELIFRKAICDGMHDVADWKVILIAGAAFSLSHFNLAQTIHQLFIGVLLAYIYIKTKNITLTMIMHCINNALALYLTKIFGNEIWQSLTVEGICFACGFVALFVGLFFLYKKSNKLENKKIGQVQMITFALLAVLLVGWLVNVITSFK